MTRDGDGTVMSETDVVPDQMQATYIRRRIALLVALVVALVAIAGFAFFGYRTFTERLDAARKLDRATTLVQDADRTVAQIDKAVREKVEKAGVERSRGASERVDDAGKMLEQAVALIDDASPDLIDDEQERAALLRDSATARQEMLEFAPAILAANAEAGSAIPFAEEGWKNLLAADEYADRAVSEYNRLTRSGVLESQRLNRQAASRLGLARERFEAAERGFSDAPFEDYVAYTDSRIRLNRLSLQSDEAWLADRLSAANELIEDYNREDRKAVAQAKKLSSSPTAAILSAHKESTERERKAYLQARARALEADERLKAF